jgi:hypothetical protein
MELKFTELPPNNIFTTNYWDEQEPKQHKRKPFGYDDILSSMNLVVNENGVLQQMLPKHVTFNDEKYTDNNSYDDKNSYIYNKYFKNNQEEKQIEIKRPQTIQEYNKMVLEQKIKAFNERKRIAQIKSTQLFFSNNITASKNNLRKLHF